jgi:hypothetical protein
MTKDWITHGVCTVAVATLFCMQVPSQSEAESSEKLDIAGVTTLLDVMDALADLHPGFEEKASQLKGSSEAQRASLFAEARRRNEASSELKGALERMFTTETYEIYFRRFQNVTRELVTDCLLDLPFQRRRSPGDICGTFYDLVRRRTWVRSSLYQFAAAADVGWVYETAQRWVPDGDHGLPTLSLIYDSNAGSYTAEGKPFFNLFSSGALDKLAVKSGQTNVREAQETMAHELQHILAGPFLASSEGKNATWQWRGVDRLTRSIVGEGMANHCSPPRGFVKEVYEDPDVVGALLRRLEQQLLILESGEITEQGMETWLRANYFEVAEALLRLHLQKRYSAAELDEKVKQHMSHRPDLEHTLGWWLVSRISHDGRRRDRALSLFDDPWRLYRLYNESDLVDSQELRITPTVVRYLEKLRSGNR